MNSNESDELVDDDMKDPRQDEALKIQQIRGFQKDRNDLLYPIFNALPVCPIIRDKINA